MIRYLCLIGAHITTTTTTTTITAKKKGAVERH